MKYFFTTFSFIALLCLGIVTAHADTNCSVLTQANNQECCAVASSDAQRAACQNFNYYNNTSGGTSSGTQTQATPGGQVLPAGTQNTNTVNPNVYSPLGQVTPLGQATPIGTATPLGQATPISASAADQKVSATCSAIKFTNLLNIAIWAKCIIGAIVIPGIFMLAFVVFLWGVFKFIRATDDVNKKEGKQFIYMGLIGLFVMVSVWGIIKIVSSTLGIDATVPVLQTDYLSTDKATK